MKKMQKYGCLFFLTIVVIMNSVHTYAQNKAFREILHEVAVQPGASIRITGNTGKLIVKSWDKPGVKVEVQLYKDSGTLSLKDEELFEELGISVKSFHNRVEIITADKGYSQNMELMRKKWKEQRYDEEQMEQMFRAIQQSESRKPKDVAKEASKKPTKTAAKPKMPALPKMGYADPRLMLSKISVRTLTVTMPADARLDIKNKYGDVIINFGLRDAELDITNGTLEAQDINNLQLIGKNCNANLGNIEKATIEFDHGTLRAETIRELDLDSKSSTIDYEKGNSLYLRSESDEIIIDEIGKVGGRKSYGNIRINELKGDLDLEGNNANIKLRGITPDVKLIRINNKYADVRLPVKNLTNYYVDFNGYYSTVFAPFQKEVPAGDPDKEKAAGTAAKTIEIPDEWTMMDLSQWEKEKRNMPSGRMAPHRFTSTVGNLKEKHTRFELICNACTVDFK